MFFTNDKFIFLGLQIQTVQFETEIIGEYYVCLRALAASYDFLMLTQKLEGRLIKVSHPTN